MNAPYKKKLTIPYRPWHTDKIEPYVMKLADDLSNDPMIRALLGHEFKVLVDYNAEAKRITYSFRSKDDITDEDDQAKKV